MDTVRTLLKWCARRTPCRAFVLLLLLIHGFLLSYGALVNSPVTDEAAHLVAGISYWHFGRFDLYRVNPPLYGCYPHFRLF
jgi:hypothetical protein